MESSLHHKEVGNRHFAAKNYVEAIASYRRGLAALPDNDNGTADDKNSNEAMDDSDAKDTNDATNNCSGEDRELTEANQLEVNLRSNLALCLLRLAEPHHPNNNGTKDGSRERYLGQVIHECSTALAVEGTNAKLWYRRGQAYLLLAGAARGNNDINAQMTDNELRSHAESDIQECERLLNLQLVTLRHTTNTTVSGNHSESSKAVIQQIMEARRTLKRIENEKNADSVNSGDGAAVDNSAGKPLTPTSMPKEETTTSRPKKSLFGRSRSWKSISNTNGNHAVVSKDNPTIPSPSEQKHQILQLLSRRQIDDSSQQDSSPHHHDPQPPSHSQPTPYPPQKGEAYFLITMTWWESWCQYVHFFHSYKSIHSEDSNHDNSTATANNVQRRMIEIDLANAKVLDCLPSGATLPGFLEKEKKLVRNNKKRSDSMSESSEESDDEELTMAPNVIDNSALILDSDVYWSLSNSIYPNSIDGNNDEINDDDHFVPLQSNLVRGHHFEILPREAYSALRLWYGEKSRPIVRRVQSVEEISWNGSSSSNDKNNAVQITLYPDRWESIHKHHLPNQHLLPPNTFLCSACRAPSAKSKCTKCKNAHYCSKSCQKSHWPYHKSYCWGLMNQMKLLQKDTSTTTTTTGSMDGSLIPSMDVWGRVGLNNLGNTCFISSAVQVSVLYNMSLVIGDYFVPIEME